MRLFLKLSDQAAKEDISEPGNREILFYQAIVDDSANLPIPRCYDAVWDDATGQFHLLLEDLSETHIQLEPPIPPSQERAEQGVDCLADLHAHFWASPRLGSPPFVTRESESESVAKLFAGFCDFLGDNLSPQRRQIYEKSMGALARLDEQARTGHRLPLTHGDAHAWNFLYPRDPARDCARLLDWEVMGVGIGTDDLAYMMTLFWYPERRARLEQPLLHRYHSRLLQRGVSDYEWETCWEDYRHSVIRKLFEPVWWWSSNFSRHLWWDRLERVLLAFDDLGCIELVGA